MDSFKTLPIQITICGGGNGAHTAAGYIASKGDFVVNVFTRQPARWATAKRDGLKITTKGSSWEEKGDFVGHLNKISSDPAAVIPGSKIILVAAPANAHGPLLKAVAPFVDDGAWVGTLYGQGGFDWAARAAFGSRLKKMEMLFGLQNIPWICRIATYGAHARIIGPKQHLYVTTFPVEKSKKAAALMERLFDIPCRTVPNFLCLTLSPSNQIIHPGRYYGIFRDWDGKKTYQKGTIPSLYADMDQFSADQMQFLDDELQAVKKGLERRYPALDLSRVLPLGPRVVEQYGADVKDKSTLKTIFCTNLGYADCPTPVTEVSPGRVIPNLKSRLFWEDIPYGLVILKSMAVMMNIPTPNIDRLTQWHQQYMGKVYIDAKGRLNPATIKETGAPTRYGVRNLDQLVYQSLPAAARAKMTRSRL